MKIKIWPDETTVPEMDEWLAELRDDGRGKASRGKRAEPPAAPVPLAAPVPVAEPPTAPMALAQPMAPPALSAQSAHASTSPVPAEGAVPVPPGEGAVPVPPAEAAFATSVPVEAALATSVPAEAAFATSVPVEAAFATSVPVEAAFATSVPVEAAASVVPAEAAASVVPAETAVPAPTPMRPVIGDQLRMPIIWCEMGSCISWHADREALGEGDARARAIGAGWRLDAFGRMACPDCQQADPTFRNPYPVVPWDRHTAIARAARAAAVRAPGR